jgi:hypothetical protein
MNKQELPTVKAVLAYAEQLRGRAERDRLADPYADPYAPSVAAARKVYQAAAATVRRNDEAAGLERPAEEQNAEAATMAQAELASRVVLNERETRRQREETHRSERRHARRQRIDRANRQAAQAGLSLGTRLDRVIAGLGLLSEISCAPLDSDRITGSPDRSRPPSGPRSRDRYTHLLGDVQELVFRLEEELSQARRREIRE